MDKKNRNTYRIEITYIETNKCSKIERFSSDLLSYECMINPSTGQNTVCSVKPVQVLITTAKPITQEPIPLS